MITVCFVIIHEKFRSFHGDFLFERLSRVFQVPTAPILIWIVQRPGRRWAQAPPCDLDTQRLVLAGSGDEWFSALFYCGAYLFPVTELCRGHDIPFSV